jgi:hypothetical protein
MLKICKENLINTKINTQMEKSSLTRNKCMINMNKYKIMHTEWNHMFKQILQPRGIVYKILATLKLRNYWNLIQMLI